MKEQLKFLFDENAYGLPYVRALREWANKSPEKALFTHLLELFPMGEDDDVWIPKIAQDGYILISADRAKRCGGAKLPDLCAKYKITHIRVAASIHGMMSFDKARAIMAIWDDLMRLGDVPRGSRFSFRLMNGRPVLIPFEAQKRRHRKERDHDKPT